MSAGPRLAHLLRHPIKSVGHEELAAAVLQPGRPVPGDRAWAVAHSAADLPGGGAPTWAAKMNFLRGVAGPELMAIRAETGADGWLTLHHPRAGRLRVDPAGDKAPLLAWLAPLWPAGRPPPARLVAAPPTGLGDCPEPFVSVLSLVSLRALGQRMRRALSIHRFRGNLWIEGLAPWEEFDLPGRRLRVGGAVLAVRERITRCKAITADPDSGRFDGDALAALEAGWDHADFGVYAEVEEGGEIRPGDPVTVLA